VTYFAYDDWSAHPGFTRWWPAYELAYARLRDSDVRVAAVSQVLLDVIRPQLGRVVANGVDANEWRAPAPPPDWFSALPGPRLLYVGVLDHRLDIAAVTEVARRFPSGTVVLLGILADPGYLGPLLDLPNVKAFGPVSRHEVAAAVHAADVCILPHRRSALTESMSPLKLYEYLAGGRPVAATDLPAVRGVSPRVHLVPGNEGFADAVALAMDEGPMEEADRLAFVAENSWAGRLQHLLELACAPDVSASVR
jgi:glycosyltransferase involved in cell wall biosynthesis